MENAMETESALTVYTVIVPGYNIFFAFQTTKTIGHGSRRLQQRGPQPQTGAQPRVCGSPTSNFPLKHCPQGQGHDLQGQRLAL